MRVSRTESFLKWFYQATDPLKKETNPYFYRIQTTAFASMAFIGTACLTCISPLRGVVVVVMTYTIARYTKIYFPKIARLDEEIDLAMKQPNIADRKHHYLENFLSLTFAITCVKIASVLLSGIAPFIFGPALSLYEIRWIATAFTLTFVFSLFFLHTAREILKSRRFTQAAQTANPLPKEFPV